MAESPARRSSVSSPIVPSTPIATTSPTNPSTPSVTTTTSVPTTPANPPSKTEKKSDAVESELVGSEAVEQDIRELLVEMDASYKNFSETVFKKMDAIREKISVLDETTVDLVRGLDDADSGSGDTLRSGRIRKRRS